MPLCKAGSPRITELDPFQLDGKGVQPADSSGCHRSYHSGAEAAAAAAQDEYRRAREALMVLDLSGYWEVQTLEGEKELAIEALVAEIERRHGAAGGEAQAALRK